MLAALESGQLGTYVTDFPNRPVIGNDKVITLPHLGASTAEAEDNWASSDQPDRARRAICVGHPRTGPERGYSRPRVRRVPAR